MRRRRLARPLQRALDEAHLNQVGPGELRIEHVQLIIALRLGRGEVAAGQQSYRRRYLVVFRSPFFRKYLLPGLVFQSLTIGGGYGTGRELVEFFLR